MSVLIVKFLSAVKTPDVTNVSACFPYACHIRVDLGSCHATHATPLIGAVDRQTLETRYSLVT